MKKKMDYDSLMALGEKLTYMMVLGFLCIICSIPVVTIGASMTAMHKAMRLYVVKGEKRLFKSFFEAFKKHFKLSTYVWLLNLLMIVILCFDLLFYGDAITWVQKGGLVVVMISLMIVIFEMTVSSVLIASEMTSKVKETIIFALKYGLKSPYEALMILVFNLVIPAILFLIAAELLVLVPGVVCYLCWQFLPKSLARYQKIMKI
ncbi:MAG: YesL family protein [Erysipelotrichaceae bacterium]|nr:YesL family protein [Erysipelotrichaceae bacterium]